MYNVLCSAVLYACDFSWKCNVILAYNVHTRKICVYIYMSTHAVEAGQDVADGATRVGGDRGEGKADHWEYLSAVVHYSLY